MKDPIEREDAIRTIDETPFLRRPILKHYIKAKIERIPSAEKQGEWICKMTKSQDQARDRWVIESVVLYCSECNGEAVKMTKFCPNCGARMKGADNEDDQSVDSRHGSGR